MIFCDSADGHSYDNNFFKVGFKHSFITSSENMGKYVTKDMWVNTMNGKEIQNWKVKVLRLPSNLCNQYALNETVIMATPPRSIFKRDAERHHSVIVYRPSSTNSQAVNTPESTMFQYNEFPLKFWVLQFSSTAEFI